MRLKYCLIIFCVIACNNSKNDINYILTNDTSKYWDVLQLPGFYQKDSSKVYPFYCYYFDKNGKRIFYQYIKGKRIQYSSGDIVIPEIWKPLTDTTILLGNTVCKIDKLIKDTFIYSNKFGQVILTSADK